MSSAKSAMSWYQTYDGIGSMGMRSSSARRGVEQPTVLVVGLIRERGCDLLNVDSGQVEHLLRLEPESSVLEGCQGRDEPRCEVAAIRRESSAPRALCGGDLHARFAW